MLNNIKKKNFLKNIDILIKILESLFIIFINRNLKNFKIF